VPTYQYACTACAERLEVVQRFTDEALTECPSCGGTLRKVYSAVGVVFKGSGFYKTDSRGSRPSSSAPAAASTSSDAGAAPSAPEKPGAKPAAKPASESSSTGSSSSDTAAAS
jgi:putative FmdB family regulatory protein